MGGAVPVEVAVAFESPAPHGAHLGDGVGRRRGGGSEVQGDDLAGPALTRPGRGPGAPPPGRRVAAGERPGARRRDHEGLHVRLVEALDEASVAALADALYET